MSLRTRLVLLTVALVVVAVVTLSWLLLQEVVDVWSADALDRARVAAQQVKTFLVDHLDQHAEDEPVPTTLEETKRRWNSLVAEDAEIASLLQQTLSSTPVIVEIQISGEDGKILASTDPSRVGKAAVRLTDLAAWRAQSFARRLYELFAHRPDYEHTVPLGIPQQDEAIFTVRMVVSPVLLRSELEPLLRFLALVSAGLLATAVAVSILATNVALRPLKRIDQTIDRIAAGEFHGAGVIRGSGEFAVVEKKLNLLGQQFEGARKGAAEMRNNVDQLLERMATQLDVASRLAAISRLTGGVAHEIKNPLNAIALRVELLRARLDNPALDEEMDVLVKEVRRLDRVVKTFLDFMRPVDMAVEELDLATLAREVAELMTPQARLQRVAIEFNSSVPAPIRGDPDMLKQAVLNLVSNAIEAMKDGGRLIMGVETAGNEALLSVEDTGPGIPAELRGKVFQLYFTTKGQGSGIGLAMTYRAVQLHNGKIEFRSEAGRGTTFRLQFPLVVRDA